MRVVVLFRDKQTAHCLYVLAATTVPAKDRG